MTDSATSGDGQSPAFDVPSPEETQRRNSFYASVSREMVGLYKEQFGRGPTKARTNYAGPDCLICTLEESLTPAERNMVALGEHQRLRDIRLFFQHAAEEEFVEIVERLSGRKVRGFVSGMDTEQDISSEVFYLEPRRDAEPGEENYP
jgi:uncharacterized protein YbcI